MSTVKKNLKLNWVEICRCFRNYFIRCLCKWMINRQKVFVPLSQRQNTLRVKELCKKKYFKSSSFNVTKILKF